MTMLRLTGRHFWMRPINQMRYEEKVWELDPLKTALVGLHCWNIGCEDGPAVDPQFAVGMASREAFGEADRIMREQIAPAMEAARRCGVSVCHVTNASIAMKDPRAREDMDPVPEAPVYAPEPIKLGWAQFISDRSYGPAYAQNSPYVHMRRAKVIDPRLGEVYVFQTNQFHRALRRRGIENLIYAGFATDMCILRAPGGIQPMFSLGYRTFLMRDATLGVEYTDTFEQRAMTFWGIRYFETHLGDTITFGGFLQACEKVRIASQAV